MSANPHGRKSVRKRQVAKYCFGPIYILRITYNDGRQTWGVSDGGGLSLFGNDRRAANQYLRAIVAHFGGSWLS